MNGVVLSVGGEDGEDSNKQNQPYHPQFKESPYILSILTIYNDEKEYSQSSLKKMQV